MNEEHAHGEFYLSVMMGMNVSWIEERNPRVNSETEFIVKKTFGPEANRDFDSKMFFRFLKFRFPEIHILMLLRRLSSIGILYKEYGCGWFKIEV